MGPFFYARTFYTALLPPGEGAPKGRMRELATKCRILIGQHWVVGLSQLVKSPLLKGEVIRLQRPFFSLSFHALIVIYVGH